MKRQKHINLVIMPIAADKGMAGTTRLRNFIKFLPRENLQITNLVLDEKEESSDYLGIRILRLPVAGLSMRKKYNRLKRVLNELHSPEATNILLYYDIPHTPVLTCILYAARRNWGYTTIVDVVEDYNTQHLNLGPKGNLRLLYCGFVQKHLHWFADGAIGISAYLMGFLRKHFSDRPVVHLPVAFDPKSIINQSKNKENNAVVVFYGGTFGEKDGMEFLLEGFEQAARSAHSLELHLTGKASATDMKKFEELLEKSSVRDRIKNHGFVSYEEYSRILATADILCMTRRDSKFANAGFPYKLGEFLATGKPVIVSRLNEIEKYLDEDDCCFVRPESSEEISEAILELLDAGRRRETGSRGKEKAYAHFNAEVVGQNLFTFINKLPPRP